MQNSDIVWKRCGKGKDKPLRFVYARDDARRVVDKVWYALSVLDDKAHEHGCSIPFSKALRGRATLSNRDVLLSLLGAHWACLKPGELLLDTLPSQSDALCIGVLLVSRSHTVPGPTGVTLFLCHLWRPRRSPSSRCGCPPHMPVHKVRGGYAHIGPSRTCALLVTQLLHRHVQAMFRRELAFSPPKMYVEDEEERVPCGVWGLSLPAGTVRHI